MQIFVLANIIGSGAFPSFPPSRIKFIGEDKNTLTLKKEYLLLCTHLISLLLLTSLSASLSFNSGLGEIVHSPFDRCQIDNMSSFKLNCLGKAKFVEENSHLDDKCQDTPDGMTGDTLIRHPDHVPGDLSVSLSPILIFSWLTQMETLKYKYSSSWKLSRKRVDSDSA